MALAHNYRHHQSVQAYLLAPLGGTHWPIQKVIDSAVKESISIFSKIIERTSVYMYRFKIDIKELAMVRNRFDKALSSFAIMKVLFWVETYQSSKRSVFRNVLWDVSSLSSWIMGRGWNNWIARWLNRWIRTLIGCFMIWWSVSSETDAPFWSARRPFPNTSARVINCRSRWVKTVDL